MANKPWAFILMQILPILFNSRQRRSFDLINPSDPENLYFKGFGTRYILAKEFDMFGNYTGTTVPTIDITTLECDVSCCNTN